MRPVPQGLSGASQAAPAVGNGSPARLGLDRPKCQAAALAGSAGMYTVAHQELSRRFNAGCRGLDEAGSRALDAKPRRELRTDALFALAFHSHKVFEAADLKRYGIDLALTMKCWLACHEEIGALLGRPELPHVAQVRAILLQALLPPDASQQAPPVCVPE